MIIDVSVQGWLTVKEDSNKDASHPYPQKTKKALIIRHLFSSMAKLSLFLLWGIFCWQGLLLLEIGNEIFNHGFFIVPGAFYLIYLQRKSY